MKTPRFCVFHKDLEKDTLLLVKVCYDLQSAFHAVKNAYGDQFVIVRLDFYDSFAVHVVDNKIFID